MYNLTLRGIAGPELDIVAVRIYLDGGPAQEFPVGPAQPFTVSVQRAASGVATIEHSFVDGAGNEGARRSQSVTIPDVAAPAVPVGDLELVSVVWA